MSLTLSEVAADPTVLTFEVKLPTGYGGTLRPLGASDEAMLLRFFRGLGQETRGFYDLEGDLEGIAREHCLSVGLYDKLRLVLDVDGDLEGIFEFSLDLVSGDVERYRRHGIELLQGRDVRYGLCLGDEIQGRGVASVLQPLLNDIARSLGASNVILWGGVRASNSRALRFYRRSGFVDVGPFVAPDGQNCVDMLLSLAGAVR